MPKLLYIRPGRALMVFCAALAVIACDTPEKRALRELSKAGIVPGGRALVAAVGKGEQRQVGWLLETRVHTERRDEKERTPLRIAVENDNPSIALMLLEGGADPNAKGPGPVSLLGVAMERGDTPVIEKLIGKGANSGGLMEEGEKILPWAIKNGRLKFAREMLAHGADPHLKDMAGDSLLHVAMSAGARDLVLRLLELGADAGAADHRGRGVIRLAVENGMADLLPVLSKAGADPNFKNADGGTPLEMAIAGKDGGLIRTLVAIGADRHGSPDSDGLGAVGMVIQSGGEELLREMILEDENLTGKEWGSALRMAYEAGNRAIATLLLEHGAIATGADEHGFTIVEDAARQGRSGWLKLLMDYGHPPGQAIYLAACRGDRLTVQLLLECGAEADFTKIPTLDTALSAAIRGGHDRTASILLRAGARPGLMLPEGQKPLHMAIVTGSHLTVRLLLGAGADPNEAILPPVSDNFLKLVPSKDMRWYLRKDENLTPLMLAANRGVIPSARYLLHAGAIIDTYTRVNRTWPINFASRQSDVGMMRLLLGQDPDRIDRHIILSLKEQRARLYDAAGAELFSTSVSSGRNGFRTREGEFVITNKHRSHSSSIYGSSMPYFQRLSCGDFGFHYGSVPGYPASHGCIRLPMSAAKKLFSMTQVGDRVSIVP